MSIPDLTFRGQLPPVVESELDQLMPRLARYVLAKTSVTQLVDFVRWTDVPYTSNNFTSDVGTWVVDQPDVVLYKYMVLASTMWLQFACVTTTLTGAPTGLRLVIPGGYVARTHNTLAILGIAGVSVGSLIWSNSTGVATSVTPASAAPKAAMGDVLVGTNGAYLQFQRNDPTTTVAATFGAGANCYNFACSACFELASGPTI